MTDWLDELTKGMSPERGRYWREKAEDEALEAQWDAAAEWWALLSSAERAAVEARERALLAESCND